MVNGKKEGKWCEFIVKNLYTVEPNDSSKADSYRLVIYKHGEIYGICRAYYLSGKLEEETPFNVHGDYENGVQKEYYENGKLKSEITYRDGRIVKTTKYDESGNEIKQ